ncbi:MAG: hemerythrin domain-containing protein [Candidatus Manganitrophus sp.]|nr:hemerythrin domain-containing protein [Candidatus Manganitrophus sp.]WDT71781.1 MAG: hemerythrin domain-containing protein [Candidatus Manganitrophus sp.]WDT80844.1 MAG: hemerythrin domain-containing protein [Candidatus Manganitrophus sp.]
MKATELLKTDHRNVIELIHQAKRVGRRNALLLNRIYDNYKVHTECELKVFYPEMKKLEREEIEKNIEEHREMDRLLDELMVIRIVKGKDAFMEDLIAFEQKIQEHFQDEEANLFPAAENQLLEKLDQLGDRIEDLKIDLRTGGYGMAA